MCGPVQSSGVPRKAPGDLPDTRKPAPWLGQHSADVLRDLGYSGAEIDAVFGGSVVFDRYRAIEG